MPGHRCLGREYTATTRRMRPRWVLLGAALLGATLLSLPAMGQPMSSEDSVKAAYLYNFAKFTRWPEAAFPDRTAPIRLCILGARDMSNALQQILVDKYVDERPVIAVPVNNTATELRSCQLIYHSANSGLSDWEVLRMVQDYPVLTIGEGGDFLDVGGVLSFVTVDQRIRFEVNLPAAKRAGINLSSRLVNIARDIRQP